MQAQARGWEASRLPRNAPPATHLPRFCTICGVGNQQPALAGLELFEAIQSGDAAKVRKLIAHDRSLASTRNDEGISAVLHAMYHGQLEIVAELVMGGVDLDVFEAAATGHVERLEELLAHDADSLASYSADGWTPLHLAAFFGQERAAALLVERGAPVAAWSRNALVNQPLHAAVAGNDTDTCRVLLEHGAPVDERQHGGFTALHGAAQNGNAQVAAMLLERGADPLRRTEDGRSPAELAREAGHVVLANRLG